LASAIRNIPHLVLFVSMGTGGWLLHCPVLRDPRSAAEASRKTKARDSKGSQKRQQQWAATLALATAAAAETERPAAAAAGARACVALPPLEPRPVCGQVRVFVLQEARLLLGGEAWDPVLVASSSGVPSKLCRVRRGGGHLPPLLSSGSSSSLESQGPAAAG
jgi:hypothetical protein